MHLLATVPHVFVMQLQLTKNNDLSDAAKTLLFVPVGNFQIKTASGCTGALEPPDFNAARCKALEGVVPTVKYLPP